jgi:predicted permease
VLKPGESQILGPRTRMRRVLVGGQITVTVVLLATGFLFLRNLVLASSQSPRFDVEQTLWTQLWLIGERYPGAESRRTQIIAGRDALRRLPGVESVTMLDVVPLNEARTSGGPISTDVSRQPVRVTFYANNVGPDYFRTMGIAILAGREFTEADGPKTPSVVILNQTLARRLFGDQNAVGRELRRDDSRMTVIGVAADSHYFTLGEKGAQAMYSPWLQKRNFAYMANYMVRTSRPPAGVARAATAAVRALDAGNAAESKPMTQALGFALLPSQAGAALLGSIGLLALVLSAIGLYGLVAYSVASKLRELGLRMALGATPGDIVRLVGREAFGLIGVGMTLGLAIAWLAARPLAMFLVAGLSPVDPAAFAGVVVTLVLVGAVATLGPALKAVRVAPIAALRHE